MTGASPGLALGDVVCREGAALSAEIDGEAVALNIERGVCYGLDAIATRIWDMITTPTAIGAVCDALVEVYDVAAETCRTDVLALMSDLLAEGLIRVESPVVSPRA